jgi:hypothetical protein
LEPVAAKLAETPGEIDKLAQQVPPDAWDTDSEYAGWSFKDHLSHLAASHEGVHEVIRTVLAGDKPDMSRFVNLDETNEMHRLERRDRSIDQLVSEAKAASDQTLDLLTAATNEHENFQMGPFTFGMAMQGFSYHDVEHLGQIRKATEA